MDNNPQKNKNSEDSTPNDHRGPPENNQGGNNGEQNQSYNEQGNNSNYHHNRKFQLTKYTAIPQNGNYSNIISLDLSKLKDLNILLEQNKEVFQNLKQILNLSETIIPNYNKITTTTKETETPESIKHAHANTNESSPLSTLRPSSYIETHRNNTINRINYQQETNFHNQSYNPKHLLEQSNFLQQIPKRTPILENHKCKTKRSQI